jgi:RNAse (barnase) inhibitor barstar
MKTVVIEECCLSTREALHGMLARSLDFPAYYGANLAALSDCLGDIDEPTRIIVRREPRERRREWLDGFCRVMVRCARTNAALGVSLAQAGSDRLSSDDGKGDSMLKLDLTQDATRGGILGQLMAGLDADCQSAIKATVEPLATSGAHFHDMAEVRAAIDAQPVSDAVKADAHAIYQVLAEAEASVHGCPVEQTHFHEVGNADAVANVLGVCLAVEALDPDAICATSVQTGQGKVQCAHGLLDIPAPATAAIIARGIPVCAERREGEWCTPTSAAIILHFVDTFEG